MSTKDRMAENSGYSSHQSDSVFSINDPTSPYSPPSPPQSQPSSANIGKYKCTWKQACV